MTDKPQRPESFEFALDFLGDPEASELRAYIEQLEARAALAEPVGELAPPAAGEVAELVALLRAEASDDEIEDHLLWMTSANARRAANLLERQAAPVLEPALARINDILNDSGRVLLTDELEALELARQALEQRQAAPVPVAEDTYFEFVISDADDQTQAGGIVPTYAQALSEGQHYLAQYQQDGPHTLELRRVEVLPPGAFPAPDGAPLQVLPEDAQVIEPTERTILVPARTPVPVSERPWEREGWCDEQGQCWMGDPGGGGFIPSWRLCRPEDAPNMKVSLPFNALPLPAGDVQP